VKGPAKSRLSRFLWTQALLGLAISVFAWGFQYKLSLYDSHKDPSHQVPRTKLLSRNERPGTNESPLIIRAKAHTKVVYAVPVFAFLVLLQALTALNPPSAGEREDTAEQSWQLRRALLRICFVRPPPVLA